MKLQYYIKNTYGNSLNYLAHTRVEDQDSNLYQPSLAFLALIGKKTIDSRDIDLAKYLGIEFERIMNPNV